MRLIHLMVLGTVAIAACENGIVDVGSPDAHRAGDRLGPQDRSVGITAMTRNVYVGTNVDVILEATDPSQVPLLVAQAFGTLVATNFPERAQALAAEIEETRPHVVGLQEISVVRLQSPGDAAFGGTVPAEDVFISFLPILLDALAARDQHYVVAAVVQNADVELPMVTSPFPTFDDVRLTDFDVILVRSDVPFSNAQAVNYIAKLTIPFGPTSIEIPRGFTAVDVEVNGTTVRFANTHLEPAFQPIKEAQAQELIAALNDSPHPVIVAGDLNSPVPTGAVYNLLLSAGYLDSWEHRVGNDGETGFTDSHADDLLNTTVDLHQRIDYLLVKNRPGHSRRSVVGSIFAVVVGDELDDRTPSGLWPSDHAGVVANMVIPPVTH